LNIFNFLRQKNKVSPKKMIAEIIEFIPEFYKDKIHYKESVEYLEYNEWGLAIDSLIELADESGHYFSNDFWLEVADVADKMNLNEQSNHCRKELEKIQAEVGWNISKGSTVLKIDDTHFEHYYSEKVKDKWTNDRQSKDKVSELLDKNAVHLKSNGRSGYLYIVDDRKIAEVEYELGVNGFIIYFENLSNWILPTIRILTLVEKEKIKSDIINWAAHRKNAIEFD
jgi:hypothetical protein